MITTRRLFKNVVWMYFQLKQLEHRFDCLAMVPGTRLKCTCLYSVKLSEIKQQIEESAKYLGYTHGNCNVTGNGEKKDAETSKQKVRHQQRSNKKRKAVGTVRRCKAD